MKTLSKEMGSSASKKNGATLGSEAQLRATPDSLIVLKHCLAGLVETERLRVTR